MFQEITIVGNLGRDPEMRYTPDGTPVTTLSVATSRKWVAPDGGKHEETIWWRVECWRKQAEAVAQYLKKGRQVMVKGRLKVDPATGAPRIWTGQDGKPRVSLEITAESVLFLGGRSDGGDTDTPDIADDTTPAAGTADDLA